jgi:hypothetical protein
MKIGKIGKTTAENFPRNAGVHRNREQNIWSSRKRRKKGRKTSFSWSICLEEASC